MPPLISIIIVSHNSEDFIETNIKFLEEQTYKNFELILVDSGSSNPETVEKVLKKSSILNKLFVKESNLGFAKANNLGLTHISLNSDITIFLNPDAFLPNKFLDDLSIIMNEKSIYEVLTGKLIRYDISSHKSTEIIDSAGIFRTWFGRWYDRGQGEIDQNQYSSNIIEQVPAICGALLICNSSVIKRVINNRDLFFDDSFFMYKEDIEVSRYLNRIGFRLGYSDRLTAFHCRGWQNRSEMSLLAKQLSAKNDVTVAIRYSKRSLPFALLKLLIVTLFKR